MVKVAQKGTVRLTSIYLEILKIENFLSEPTEILKGWSKK
jgi:hypothetical protein